MSTEYKIVNKGGVEINILEHSNLFNIYIEDIDSTQACITNLSIDDMKEMIQKMVNVVSYFDYDYEGCEVKYD